MKTYNFTFVKKYPLLLFLSITITTSCIEQTKKGESENTSQMNKEEDSINKKEEDSENNGIDPEELFFLEQQKKAKEKIISMYDSIIAIDTILNVDNDKIQIKFKYYCLLDSGLRVPQKYYDSKEPFLSHNFASDLEILKNTKRIYSKTIDKEMFKSILFEELNEYGALLFPSFKGLDTENKELVFHFSITIPATDVGKSATLYVGLEGEDRISQY
ncbi:DUF4738 domain-containing protein [Marivirga lumbricoides]